MSTGKKVAIAIGVVVVAVLLVICGYLFFVVSSMSRLGDASLEVEGEASSATVQTDTTYSIATYNLGFGANSQDYSCIPDTGYIQDSSGNWVLTQGQRLKAVDAEEVRTNTNGAMQTLKSLSADFILTQEVDTQSDRSRNVNQKKMLQGEFSGYASTYAVDNHTPFIAYPLSDMEGFVNSGLLTLSRFAIQSSDRHELTISNEFLSRLFNLDTCFSASYVNVSNGKQLVIVNIHLNMYEASTEICEQQREELYSFISSEFAKDNYVIVGGDFNHDLLTNNPNFPEYTTETPAFSTWYTEKAQERDMWFNENGSAQLPLGFSLIASDNWPTCRETAVAWTPGFNEVYTFDGYLVSNNIRVVSHKNIETDTEDAEGFAYSDHEPAYMEFVLE